MRRLLLTLIALLLLTPAAASAAQVTIGNGSQPNLAVDAAGTAYIAWYDNATSQLHFCRLPRNAAACDVNTTLPVDGQTLYRPFIRVEGAQVDIFNSRYGFAGNVFYQVHEYSSSDGGVSFGAPTAVGTMVFDEAAFLPGGGGLLGATNADGSGGAVQYMLSGLQTQRAILFGQTYLYDGTVAFLDQTITAIAVFTDASSNAQFRVFQGRDYNNVGDWNPASAIDGYTSYPKLADGPSGLFLLSGADGGGLQVRRFNGGGFTAPVPVLPGVEASQADLYQDAGGRLHAVGPRFEADGIHLYHAVSDDGVNWSSGTVTTQATEEQDAARVAAAPDHIGYAVWRSSGTSDIVAATIGPGAPGPAPPAPPPPPAPPAPAPVPVPVFHQTVVARVVSGTVRVRRPGAKDFVVLSGTGSVPLGSTIDVKQGRIALSSVPKAGAAAQTAQFYDGLFKVTQPGSITQLQLNEALASCGKGAKAAAKKPKSRKLWGDGSGSFRTRGQYSAATVRGTTWLVQDSCAGTLTQVKKGAVTVRDLVRSRTVIVRAGKKYLARPKR